MSILSKSSRNVLGGLALLGSGTVAMAEQSCADDFARAAKANMESVEQIAGYDLSLSNGRHCRATITKDDGSQENMTWTVRDPHSIRHSGARDSAIREQEVANKALDDMLKKKRETAAKAPAPATPGK